MDLWAPEDGLCWGVGLSEWPTGTGPGGGAQRPGLLDPREKALGARTLGSQGGGGWGLEFLDLRKEGAGSLDSWLRDGDLVCKPGLLGQEKPNDGS